MTQYKVGGWARIRGVDRCVFRMDLLRPNDRWDATSFDSDGYMISPHGYFSAVDIEAYWHREHGVVSLVDDHQGTIVKCEEMDQWSEQGLAIAVFSALHGTSVGLWSYRLPESANTAQSPGAPPEAVHSETIDLGWRKDAALLPASMVDAALDRGERQIRRTLRAWPESKVLKHRQQQQQDRLVIEWYWEATQ